MGFLFYKWEETKMQYKVTLDTGKVVVLRNMEMKHYRRAVEVCAKKAGNNQTLLNMYVQDEILKSLIVSVNGEALKPVEREAIDSYLGAGEYRQLMMVVEEQIGEAKRPQVEIQTTEVE